MAERGAPTRWWRLAVSRSRTDPTLITLDFGLLLLIAVVTSADRGRVTLTLSVLGVVLTVWILAAAGLYRPRITVSALDDLPRLGAWSIIVSGVFFALVRSGVSFTRATQYALFVFVALFCVRVVYYALLRRRRRNVRHRRRLAVIGDGVVAAELVRSARSFPGLGLEVACIVSDDPMPLLYDTGVPIESGPGDIADLVSRLGVDTLVVAFSSTPDSALVQPLRGCDELDCEIYLVPRLFEFTRLTPGMDRIHTIPLVHIRRDALRTWHWQSKRAFDLVMVTLALILVAPLMAIIATAVRLDCGDAPVIFRQQRIGRNGVLFDVLKFRSMRPVPATRSDVEWQPADVDRISRLGAFLRKTSLDELPQLWNVMRGEMSIVGPRPERPHFVEQFVGTVHGYVDRHRVPVGLTGWAAINGLRGDTSISDRALYDNYYIENWSIWLDTKIIVRTVGSVVRGTGR
ncbi:exopolysaccharide biosynthesis polyprenyl glycosylphosphotransferase [Gordonia sp. NPDC003376]